MNNIAVYFGEKKEKTKLQYTPSKVEGHLEKAIGKHKLSFDKPEHFDLSELPLRGGEPVIERLLSEGGVRIRYQRWFKNGVYDKLIKYVESSNIKTLVEMLNNSSNTWEAMDFSNSFSSDLIDLFFHNDKLDHTDIWASGVGILEDAMEKALRCDISFTEEFMENIEPLKERIKKIEILTDAEKKMPKEQLGQYCEQHNIPKLVVEQHKYHGGYSIKNNVVLGYLLSSRDGEPFEVMEFINYLRDKKVALSDERIIKGFVDATIEGQKYFLDKKLKDAENIGRSLLKLRISGEQDKDFDRTGKDKIVDKFKEAISYRELFSSDQEKAQYIVGLIDGIFLETLKRTGE